MKKLFALLFAAFSLFSCQYDDLWIKDELEELDDRISALESLCKTLNSDIKALNDIVAAIQSNELVKEIVQITEGSTVTGYKIVFESGKEIVINNGKNGKDGEDGKDGENGKDGEDGKNGKDGYIPQISVKQDTDGEWYWTIDGEWMLGEDGEKVSTTGRTDLTPMLKIEEEYWYISYDGGQTWAKLEKAVGEDGDSYFKEVTYDSENVYLTLADGTTITVPMASTFELILGISNDIPCLPCQVITIPYVLNGGDKNSEVITISEGDWRAEVFATSSTEGTVRITVPENLTYGKVAIVASNQKKTIVKTLSFSEGVFESDDKLSLSVDGGQLSMNISTNYDYEISVDAPWIRYVETKTVRDEVVVFEYDVLDSNIDTRSATITFTDKYCGVICNITVTQGSLVSLDKRYIKLVLDEETQLVATNLSTTPDLVWTSSNSDVAWVSPEGKVIAVSEGTATITVTTSDNEHSASCQVEVININSLIYLEYGSASNVSYSDGYVHYGTQLTWYFYNNSSVDIYAKYAQLVDAYGTESNQMALNEIVEAYNNTGWVITLGSSYKAPKLKLVYEYKGKEYSCICGHMFN